jgi:glycosyltransferase involved in cell wall biosynthesis
MMWQVLDVRAVWIKEFAAALSRQVPVLGWLPNISPAGRLQDRETEFAHADPPLSIRSFPLQRGFARFPFDTLLDESTRIVRRLSNRAGKGPLVCTTPHYAAVAEKWDLPVIYYVTDFFPAYRNEPDYIGGLDKAMCAAATLVCANSQRIADYLQTEPGCAAEKIVVIPNATRGSNILAAAPANAAALPVDIADLPRPVAGVIGNLAANTNWTLLLEVIDRTPWLSWAFVGPTDTPIQDRDQRQARQALMKHQRVRFPGQKPYSELIDYARAFDVAVLPYRKVEPTFSGSSTRFYEHLAACRPMIATRCLEELLHKEPLLRLVDTPSEMTSALEALRELSFHDGQEELRWRTSCENTWDHRAGQMIAALSQRVEFGRVAAA